MVIPNFIYIIPLFILPIYYFGASANLQILVFVSLLGFLWYDRIKNNLRFLGLVIGFAAFVYALISATQILDTNRLIFGLDPIEDAISLHQRDAQYLPFRLRSALFNSSVYIYYFFQNIARFFNLKNFYDTLLLVNLYPLILGIVQHFRTPSRKSYGLGALMCLVLLSVGLTKSPDKYQVMFASAPLWIYLAISGLPKIDRRIYWALAAITIIMVTSPIL